MIQKVSMLLSINKYLCTYFTYYNGEGAVKVLTGMSVIFSVF